MTTPVETLRDRLRSIGASWAPSGGSWDPSLREVAGGILYDPQRCVDALVASGVLEACSVSWSICGPGYGGQFTGPGYRLALPKLPTLCKFCGEPVEPWTFSQNCDRPGPGWRHANGDRQCLTLAEPADA
jgi:hypothetical protein